MSYHHLTLEDVEILRQAVALADRPRTDPKVGLVPLDPAELNHQSEVIERATFIVQRLGIEQDVDEEDDDELYFESTGNL